MINALILFSKNAIEKGQADAEAFSAMVRDAAVEQGIDLQIQYTLYDDLLHYIDGEQSSIIDTKSGRDIASFDVVYQRRWGDMPEHALACAIYLRKKNIRVIDRESYSPGSRNKLTQAWRLWEASLPHPATVYANRDVAVDQIIATTSQWPIAWPLILKGVNATRGNDNYLVKSEDAMREKLALHPGVDFLVQAFVPNDGDYRVLVCGSTIELIMHRQAATDSHLNNTSQGGDARLVEDGVLPEQALADAVKAAQAFERDIAGVDLVFDKDTGQHYFFEVNRAPQIESGQFTHQKAAAIARALSTKD